MHSMAIKWGLFLLFITFSDAVLAAATTTLFDGLAQGLLDLFSSKLLIAIGTVAIIVAAIMALSGNIRPMTFITIAAGIFIMFAAPKIVGYFQTLGTGAA